MDVAQDRILQRTFIEMSWNFSRSATRRLFSHMKVREISSEDGTLTHISQNCVQHSLVLAMFELLLLLPDTDVFSEMKF
jgi:hypothetical protein